MPTYLRKTILLATDPQRSVLSALDGNRSDVIAYAPYGHCPFEKGFLSSLGFNGELPDSMTGHYQLGKGYRQFNPALMRFNSPDSWSPFGEGGLNAYGYCGGDPINRQDPTGHTPAWLKPFLREIGVMSFPDRRAVMAPRSPDLAQINTQKNVKLPIPDDKRSQEINQIRNFLESKRQNRAFQRAHNLDTPPGTKKSKQFNKELRELRELRKKYSTLVAQHHNATPTAIGPERPKVLKFSDHYSIHEVEIQVSEPAGGWRKMADLRR